MRQRRVYVTILASIGFVLIALALAPSPASFASPSAAPAGGKPPTATPVPPATATVGPGATRTAVPSACTAAVPCTVEIPIVRGSDDAGMSPYNNCNPLETANEIYLGTCDPGGYLIYSGLRFENVLVPRNATILEAHLVIVTDGLAGGIDEPGIADLEARDCGHAALRATSTVADAADPAGAVREHLVMGRRAAGPGSRSRASRLPSRGTRSAASRPSSRPARARRAARAPRTAGRRSRRSCTSRSSPCRR